jgi:hypothetical protein
MGQTRLVIIDGIPGSGKTTTSKFVHDVLEQAGVAAMLYQEGELDHPADFEFVAGLGSKGYAELLARHADSAPIIERYSQAMDAETLVFYGKIAVYGGLGWEADVVRQAAEKDICDELPASDYIRLAQHRWAEFAEAAARQNAVGVFECCFLQNPITILRGKHGVSDAAVESHIRALWSSIQKLEPLLVYLYQDDVKATLEAVAAERPQKWLDGVTRYVTTQGYGKALGLEGFAGMVKFYEDMQDLGVRIADRLPIRKLVLHSGEGDWDARHKRIEEFLRQETR